jgi:uncharacterized protein (TIGR00303 family)
MIRIYTQAVAAQDWLDRHRHQPPLFACVLGFTATALIPGISAAGATPDDRRYTALADAEFLVNGVGNVPAQYPLPPLSVGVSPTFIARAVVEGLAVPVCLFNAGLAIAPPVFHHDLGGTIAATVTSGQAMTLAVVQHLFAAGMRWGETLAKQAIQTTPGGYLVIGECVVGGTTTALALLTGLGIAAAGRVNSSHPSCNHAQKAAIVALGLQRSRLNLPPAPQLLSILGLVAAIGDPMQPVVAGMLLTASRYCGVMLAGGTQMLAVYALAQALAQALATTNNPIDWQPQQVVVGTTRWVAEDATGDTVGLAAAIGAVPLMATQLSFQQSRLPQLNAYEQGFVKEGVGAGGLAIAAHLYADWTELDYLRAIEDLVDRHAAQMD